MRLFFRVAIVAAVGWLAWLLFQQARAYGTGEQTDATKVIAYFGGAILLTVLAGVIFALSLLPVIAEHLSNLFYSPSEEIEKDPHSDARSKVAQGDFPGAIEEYEKICAANPEDTLALSEMAKVYCDKLETPEAGAAVLEKALEREWPQDEAAFLASRLVDVYWNYQRDAVKARQLLIQIAENFPETRHAANAQHRLHEIDQALASGEA
jgi:tetratricopeptide (TPR) repeat protein